LKKQLLIVILFLSFFSCKREEKIENAVARVVDKYLFEEDIVKRIPDNLSKEDSILYRKNLIKNWATEELLLRKAKINIEDKNKEIENLVKDYERELFIDKYKQAVLQQETDTIVNDRDIDNYYEQNKDIYKLNEKLIQLKYIHFNKNLNDKDEIEKLFKSKKIEDINILIDRELEFNSYNFNDSIWISFKQAERKLPILKEVDKLKKNQFIQKEDSLGVYLLAVKNILYRNDIAPKSYVIPTIKQMILHKRKLDLIKKIEQTLVNDAISKKQFEEY
jgi:hypothetical protein